MKKFIGHMILVLALMIVWVQASWAEEERLLRMESEETLSVVPKDLFFEYVNEARENPVETLTEYGFDPAMLSPEVLEGLPIVAETSVTQTLAETRSYTASIRFLNYMSPEEAVGILFETMLTEELYSSMEPMIFNPDLVYADVEIIPGWDQTSGYSSYTLSCAFVTQEQWAVETLLFFINYARTYPAYTALMSGLDSAETIAASATLAQLPAEGVTPVALDSMLTASASAHASDMLANGYVGTVSLAGLTPAERASQQGHQNGIIKERNGIAIFCNAETVIDGLYQVFFNLVSKEVNATQISQCALFDGNFTDVGIGIAYGSSPGLGGYCPDRVLVVTLDFGRKLWIFE